MFSEEVRLNSKVQVKYINDGKDITFYIVSTENIAIESVNEFKISITNLLWLVPCLDKRLEILLKSGT